MYDFGNGPKKVFYFASIHANELITTNILMKFIEDYSIAYINDDKLYDYSITKLFKECSIYIAPMTNPDGVDLFNNVIPTNSIWYKQAKEISDSFPYIPFPDGWKANINGVDLNLQFPAKWEDAKTIKYSNGFTKPAPRDFVGYGPLTEPESLCLYDFALKKNFDLSLCYHTQGEVIYWQFQNLIPPNSYEIGIKLSEASNYLLSTVPYSSSFAGFKDWFIQDFFKPSYTIEAGLGINPIPITDFDEIYKDNIGILILSSILI